MACMQSNCEVPRTTTMEKPQASCIAEPQVAALGPCSAATCTTPGGSSEQVCLLHDAQELLLIDLTVAITIGLIDHLLQLFIGHALTQLLCNALQVLEGDLARLIVIEETECLQDFILGIAIQDLVSHHLQELLIPNGAGAVVVYIGDHLLDLLLLWFEAQGAHGDLQLLGVDLAGAICVEQVKSLLD